MPSEEYAQLTSSYVYYEKLIIVVVLLSTLYVSIICAQYPVWASETEPGTDKHSVKGEYVVKLRGAATEEFERSIAECDGKITGKSKLATLKIEISEKSEEKFFKKMYQDKNVEWFEPNYLVEATFLPNDPSWNMQWGPQRIGAAQAWDLERGSQDVLVVLIDTGVCYTHPDLVERYLPGGYDWVNHDDNPFDDNGHGTHCAGIVAASINNEMGVAGLAQVSIMAEKFLNSRGSGSSWDAAQAIVHAIDVGKTISNRTILSNSWGSPYDSSAIKDAIDYASQNGALIVAAAGNSASSTPFYPAAYSEVISVSATDSNDHLASFSNYGNKIELAAPGVDIYSTYLNGTYKSMSGTSMAAPHVAGVASLVWSCYPSYSRYQVQIVLDNTADDLGDTGCDQYYGYGRVNAFRAMQGIQPHDIRVNKVDTPSLLFTESSAKIKGAIQNIGSNNESNINVQLVVNGSVAGSKVVSEIQTMEIVTVEFDYEATSAGACNITIHLLPSQGETSILDNWKSRIVSVQDVGKILLVSDDDGKCFRSMGTSADEIASVLYKNGHKTTVWSESAYGRPSLSTLLKFEIVFWTCGDYWDWAVDQTDAENLVQYLNSGGSVFLEGDDIGLTHGDDVLMTSVAHATGQVDSSGGSGLTVIQTPHPICEGTPSSFGWSTNPISPDGIAPTNGGKEAFHYTDASWSAAVASGNGGAGSTVFFAFPLSCLEESIREKIIENSVGWLQKSYVVKIEPNNPEAVGLKVYIDKVAYTLPASIPVEEGFHGFAVWPNCESGGSEYIFESWKDESGQVISSDLVFTYGVQSNRTLYVCFREWRTAQLVLSTDQTVNVVPGQEMELTVTVANNGTGSVSDINVKLILPQNITLRGTESQQIILGSILPGGSYTVTWHIIANQTGAFRAIVISDGRDNVGDPTVDLVRLTVDVQ